jgi:starch synthase (maltosyl-transferring)
MAKTPRTEQRVVIESVVPEVDCGRFPAKRVLGDPVVVEADVFCDGHDRVAAVLRHRAAGTRAWSETTMEFLGNDRWRAVFTPDRLGNWQFEITGWVDDFATWVDGLEKKVEAGVDVAVDLQIGARLVEAAAARARGKAAADLEVAAADLGDDRLPDEKRAAIAVSGELGALMASYPDRSRATTSATRWEIVVDRDKAVFSTWYELFPRSWSPVPGRHGTLADVEANLEYVAGMGFDVLYLPPIHPIGTTMRKGPNNSLDAADDDPGVPWAIGSAQGGHTAIKPELGDLGDLRSLRERAASLGVELALDIAFQCSPDHPWLTEHPEWFRLRPDGTVQYAENPPKKYEDIYPLDFQTEDRLGLWDALRDVFAYWIGEGIRIFRVDNPHTKAFPFWEWVIGSIRAEHPDVVFLAEAFTRPAVMYQLAKLGFDQSYTYFAWRQSRHDLVQYMSDLAEVKEFFRPNFWPNTPDILTEQLQTQGRPAFITRYVLAATLSAGCGIYGPAFELMEHRPLRPGSEEYRDSEKYEIREWDLDREDSLSPIITRVNAARTAHPALQRNHNLVFHDAGNDLLLAYSRREGDDVVLAVVNLDPDHVQSGWIDVDPVSWGLGSGRGFDVLDVLTERRYQWRPGRNFVELDPEGIPAHVFWVGAPSTVGAKER